MTGVGDTILLLTPLSSVFVGADLLEKDISKSLKSRRSYFAAAFFRNLRSSSMWPPLLRAFVWKMRQHPGSSSIFVLVSDVPRTRRLRSFSNMWLLLKTRFELLQRMLLANYVEPYPGLRPIRYLTSGARLWR